MKRKNAAGKKKVDKRVPQSRDTSPEERAEKTTSPDDILLSPTDLARVLDISVSRIGQFSTNGVLYKSEYGIFPMMQSVHGYIRFLRKGTPGNKAKLASFDKERTRLTAARANIAENELALQSGTLLERSDIEKAWDSMLELVRSRVITLADRMAPRVVDESNLEVIREMIREDAAAILTELMNAEMKYESDTHSDEAVVINRALDEG